MPLILPNDFVNDTTADAAPVQQNYSTIEQYMNANVVTRDGNVAMDAPLLLAGAPSQPNHASTKAYVDTATTDRVEERRPRPYLLYTPTAGTTSGTTQAIVADVVVPAQAVAGFVSVNATLQIVKSVAADFFYVDIVEAVSGAQLVADWPCNPGSLYHTSQMSSCYVGAVAGVALTFRMRIYLWSGTGTATWYASTIATRLDCIWMPGS